MRLAAAAPALASAAVTTACGTGDAVVIGSKNFTEQNLLAEIVAQELESRDVPVQRRFHLGGTFVCHRAITGGEIDLYIEYTGTALAAILEEPSIQDAEAVHREVSRSYRERWDLIWGPPLGFENTFALVVRRSDADSLDLARISDLARVAPGLTAAFGPEFMAREDGYPGLRETYGIEFGRVRQMDLGLMYRAIEQGAVDVAVANSTDGQIAALDLVVLTDDRDYFPPYQAAPVLRPEVLARWPAVGQVVRELAGSLTVEEMRILNGQVDVERRDVADVARIWREGRRRAAGGGSPEPEWRDSMKADLLHTMVRVKDLDRSVRFYTEVLGMKEARRKVLEKARATLAFLVDEDGGHPIELTYNHDGRDYELGNQFGHFAFAVGDLEAAREELASHGVEFSRGPYRVGGDGSMIAFIEDPDGIEIELIERR